MSICLVHYDGCCIIFWKGRLIKKTQKVSACITAKSGVHWHHSGVFKLFLALLNLDGERSAFVQVSKLQMKCHLENIKGRPVDLYFQLPLFCILFRKS